MYTDCVFFSGIRKGVDVLILCVIALTLCVWLTIELNQIESNSDIPRFIESKEEFTMGNSESSVVDAKRRQQQHNLRISGSQSSLSMSSGSSTEDLDTQQVGYSLDPVPESNIISTPQHFGSRGSGGEFVTKKSNSNSNSSSPGNQQKLQRRSQSGSSLSDEAYGWFDDLDSPRVESSSVELNLRRKSSATPAFKTPFYILESSLETQKLWYQTAGLRPKQPEHERKYFETLWEENLKNSIAFHENASTSTTRSKYDDCDTSEQIWFKGYGSFSNAVSRAFLGNRVTTVTIQLPRFKIARVENVKERASYLIVVSINGVHYGRWKQHSDFETLASRIQELDCHRSMTPDSNSSFHNSLLSWQCLLHRKPWYRCLDKEYLALKCFLLERFCHDVLFESQSPELLSDFIGIKF
jgi:hypothetical protein